MIDKNWCLSSIKWLYD